MDPNPARASIDPRQLAPRCSPSTTRAPRDLGISVPARDYRLAGELLDCLAWRGFEPYSDAEGDLVAGICSS